MPKSEKHRQDKITTGPASTTSITSGEALDFQDDDNLSRLTAVVGEASRHVVHCTCTLSSVWIQKLDSPLAKDLMSSDSRDANVLSCLSRLLLHFYPRINTDEREHVDETVELILGVFAEIQARLQFKPDITDKVIESVKTQRHLFTADTDTIHGIPSVLSKVATLISRVQEKFVEFHDDVMRDIILLDLEQTKENWLCTTWDDLLDEDNSRPWNQAAHNMWLCLVKGLQFCNTWMSFSPDLEDL